MGSFSVSCSMSGISIVNNDPTCFFILTRRRWAGIGCQEIDNDTLFLEQNHFYDSYLPLYGQYDDYGKIDDIVRDANVEALEKHFGLDINKVVKYITEPRDVFNSCSEKMQDSCWLPELLKHTKINFHDAMKSMGFVDADEGYVHPDCKDVRVKISNDDSRYTIIKDEKILKRGDRNDRPDTIIDFCRHFYEVTEILMHIKPEFREKLSQFKYLSGMFVHKYIYDYMSKPYRFDTWNRDYDFNREYNEYRKFLCQVAKLNKRFEHTKDADFMIQGVMLERNQSENNQFMYTTKYWYHWANAYKEYIMRGKLKKEMNKFFSFMKRMYSCNKFFFPALAGEQYGNDEEQKKLMQKALVILDKRIKERKEWDDNE